MNRVSSHRRSANRGAVILLSAVSLAAAAQASDRATPSRVLGFAERVAAQEAIERAYYSHQVGATRPFEDAVPRRLLERKVRTYLAQSAALERFWRTPIMAAALERELDRIAAQTRSPERLVEIYRALNDDAFLVLECFARPILADRLTRHFFASDQRVHGAARVKADRLRHKLLSKEMKAEDALPGRTTVDLDPAEQDVPGGWDADGVTQVIERSDAFVVMARLGRAESGRISAAVYEISKRRWEEWLESQGSPFASMAVLPAASEQATLPVPRAVGPLPEGPGAAGAPCGAFGSWDPQGLSDALEPRPNPSAVWTGTEMIVWGGGDYYNPNAYNPFTYSNGSRYDPLTDTWRAISEKGAPVGRFGHSTVWTGQEMIVWGGYDDLLFEFFSDGARYNPATDTWSPITKVGAPLPTAFHTAIWSGTEMIVWGGGYDTGARYNPATDTWTPTSVVGAPAPRFDHTAVWTGARMIVWGGHGNSYEVLNSGGLYDPVTDDWQPTPLSDAPIARAYHSAVWTGTEMIVWGGDALAETNQGGRYDPNSDVWTPTSTLDAPSARGRHSAVWTGTHMIIWGGLTQAAGGIYDPSNDSWEAMTLTNAPAWRLKHAAVWTDTHMIVWGGVGDWFLASGGRFDPIGNSWTPTSEQTIPGLRSDHSAVWTGTQMIVFGGGGPGARYDPLVHDWSPTSTVGQPRHRSKHTAVWTGTQMIVWAGDMQGTIEPTGGRYDPIMDEWSETSLTDAPSIRSNHTAVWTGARMIVWGGVGPGSSAAILNSGGLYDPVADDWTPTATLGAPSPRERHSAVWTGTEMIVWGGGQIGAPSTNTGGRYDPSFNTWSPTQVNGAPAARMEHVAVWTGTEMLVHGGGMMAGGRYLPGGDSWAAMSQVGLPRVWGSAPAAVWTGERMIVWGGQQMHRVGGEYNPATDSWSLVSAAGAPKGRRDHTAVWTGEEMLVLGGDNLYQTFGSGAGFRPGGGSGDADGDGDGFECNADCDDGDGMLHAFPGDVTDLVFNPDRSTLLWSPPADAGGTGWLNYDALRSSTPGFGSTRCLEWGDADTTARDSQSPAAGTIFFYRVRPDNGCSAGAGPAGFDSSGNPRFAASCPIGG